MITSRMKRQIRREMSAEKPTIRVGKEGATRKVVNEVSRQLENREIVKVRILKTALKEKPAKNLASKISEQTESTLIDLRGHTFILYRPREREGEKSL